MSKPISPWSDKTKYQTNKIRSRLNGTIRKRDAVRKLREEPCTDCGERYPWYVMEFDHCRGEKIDNIARLITNFTLSTLLEEIAKCDLVCANCHKIRTHHRRDSDIP